MKINMISGPETFCDRQQDRHTDDYNTPQAITGRGVKMCRAYRVRRGYTNCLFFKKSAYKVLTLKPLEIRYDTLKDQKLNSQYLRFYKSHRKL